MREKLPFYNELMIPYHKLRAGVTAARRKFPARGMRVIAVTGTNGKTTTCFMIWKMLRTAGINAGVMTTVGWGAEKIEQQIEHMTTESAEILNKRIAQLKTKGVQVLVLEVTSHALAQGRIAGIPIEVAVLTNVTHDHLDYHRTFERYVKAKQKLFRRAKFAVLNADEPKWREFARVMGVKSGLRGEGEKMRGLAGLASGENRKNYATYGIENGDLRAFEIKMGVSGVNYACGDIKNEKKLKEKRKEGRLMIEVKIPGKFNVYNSLAAVAVGRYLGFEDEMIERGLAALTEVEGRMNLVEAGQDFTVIVDYAHTPDAFLKVYEAVGSKKVGRVITVTGGAGRRDESTRYERGLIAGRGSDVLIVTEDDSRDENPEMIAREFVRGAVKAGMRAVEAGEIEKMNDDGRRKGGMVAIEIDRRRAIRWALKLARKDDIVLILGKGHEKTILRAGGAEAFEDLKVAREELLKLQK